VARLISVKPLVHPALEDITVEGILHALSDSTRVQIFAQLADSAGSSNCTALNNIAGKDIPKSTLSQHFKVLRECGLVRSERVGVEMQNSSRCQEIETRFPGLLTAIVSALKTQSGQRPPKRKPR
jgi:DNA-binding transcriptional ArsR family regulator